MCGIAGWVRFDGARVDPGVLLAMTRTLVHRGPDEEGYFLNLPSESLPSLDAPVRGLPGAATGSASAGFGHRRLSIIDLSHGQQPLCNEDGSVWISFNGEIYNFPELHEELEARGHRFRTRSDTEVIVHGYEEWGTGVFERLRGMFAIALWDERRQRCVLGRDRVGKKPLYYAWDGKRLLFGSEIKAILQAPGVPRELDASAFSDYLSLLYVPAPRSIFRAVSKLPAGHFAVVDAGGVKIENFWQLRFDTDHGAGEEQQMERIRDLLAESTRIRMISEVPLGAFLSGGIDSSAVVAFMAQNSETPVRTSSIGFSVAAYDETRYAQRVADLFGTDHDKRVVTPDALGIIEKLAWHYDEPFADSSAVPTFYVSEAARDRVTVALSGDGGDENFCGYRRYAFDLRENLVRSLVPGPLRTPVFGGLGRLYPKADFLPRIFRGKAFISNVARDPVEAYCFSMSAFQEEDKAKLLAPGLLRELGGHRTVDVFRRYYDEAPADDHMSRIQYLDIKTYLCDDILTKVDRASMAVSLEVRCPILDHRFIEYAATIPWQRKIRGGDKKRILKRALRPLLPDDILYRAKMGFGVPILEWLRSDLKDYAHDLILGSDATDRYFQRGFLQKIWDQHQSGMRNRATELWILLMFNLWHRRFMESVPAAPDPAARVG